jgi:ATP-dependent RNA helicase DDX23/PRP28
VFTILCFLDDDRYGGDRFGGRGGKDRRQPPPPPPPPPGGGYQNGIPTAPRAQRERSSAASGPSSSTSSPAPPTHSSMPPPPTITGTNATTPNLNSTPYVPPMTDVDLSAIRSRYLGVDKKKRKIRKMNDRKFVFDWDVQDDTAADMPAPPVAQGQGVAQVMFGRGHIAGMDDYQSSGSRRTDLESNLADPIERRKAQKSGTDERHWSDKPLTEMKERDWRIFREDFSIAARGITLLLLSECYAIAQSLGVLGGSIPHPLRSWTESTIPPQILEIIEKIGYKEPSPIQRQAIPIGLQNRDIIGIAETGMCDFFIRSDGLTLVPVRFW